MKTKLFALILLFAPCMGFAQGKVGFGNDSNHLIILGGYLLPDAALAGQPIPAGPLPSGITLVAGLFAGTSSTSLTLQSATTLLAGTGWLSPGRMTTRSQVLTIPGGIPQWFQIAIWDAAFASPGASQTYVGYTPLFQCTPGTSITYPSIMPGSPANSTLHPALNIVVITPEPSSAAMLLLGGLVLHHVRRMKKQTTL